MLGWTVLNNLKLDPATRHIPVQICRVEEERQHGLAHGAFSYLVKPATTEDLEARVRPHQGLTSRRTRSGCWSSRTTTSSATASSSCSATTTSRSRPSAPAREALDAAARAAVRLLRLDLRLPDMTGFELLEQMQAEPALRDVPVVVFTGKDLTAEEEARLKAMAKSIVLKDVQSPERLFDETALFLHRVVADLPRASGRCSSGCTARTKCCAAARCWSWTTTRATSSR